MPVGELPSGRLTDTELGDPEGTGHGQTLGRIKQAGVNMEISSLEFGYRHIGGSCRETWQGRTIATDPVWGKPRRPKRTVTTQGAGLLSGLLSGAGQVK